MIEDILKQELLNSHYNGMSADEAFASLTNGRKIKTVSQKNVPLSLPSIMAVCSSQSLGKLVTLPCLTDIRDKIQNNDRDGVKLWGQLLAAAGIITPEECQEITRICGLVADIETFIDEPPRMIGVFNGNPDFKNTITRSQFDTAWLSTGR